MNHRHSLSPLGLLHRAGIGLTAITCLALLSVNAQPSLGSTQPSPPLPADQIGAVAGRQYQGEGLSVTATADGARLRCDFQQLEGQVTSEGLWLSSTATDSAGERFRVLAAALGREAEPTISPAALPITGSVTVHGSLVRFNRAGLTEEYSVSMDGVRQDFVVGQRPAGNGGLRLELSLTGARAEASARGARLVLDGSGRKLAYSAAARGRCQGTNTRRTDESGG